MLLGYKITLAFMRILSLLCVCFLSLFVSNVSAQVVEKVFDILGRDSLSVQRNIAVSDSDSIRLVGYSSRVGGCKIERSKSTDGSGTDETGCICCRFFEIGKTEASYRFVTDGYSRYSGCRR